MDPYIMIHCESETVKSEVIKNCRNPEWNIQAIFYRKQPDSNIKVEVNNHMNNFHIHSGTIKFFVVAVVVFIKVNST